MAKNLSKSNMVAELATVTTKLTSVSALPARTTSTSPTSRMANLSTLKAAFVTSGPTGGNSTKGTNGVALAFLSSVGCFSIDSMSYIGKKDYSLVYDATDVEIIDNENILDRGLFNNLTNKNVSSTDKFSNDSDPFFNLDDAISTASARARQKRASAATKLRSEADFTQFAADMYRYQNPLPGTGVVVDTISSAEAARGLAASAAISLGSRISRSSLTSRTRTTPSAFATAGGISTATVSGKTKY
tara:strand:+ start:433 stop:1167 length:735 start_codon:yes stop_codon:yes gene_type:complete